MLLLTFQDRLADLPVQAKQFSVDLYQRPSLRMTALPRQVSQHLRVVIGQIKFNTGHTSIVPDPDDGPAGATYARHHGGIAMIREIGRAATVTVTTGTVSTNGIRSPKAVPSAQPTAPGIDQIDAGEPQLSVAAGLLWSRS